MRTPNQTHPTATWTTAEGDTEVYILEDDGDHLLVEEKIRKGTWYAHLSQVTIH